MPVQQSKIDQKMGSFYSKSVGLKPSSHKHKLTRNRLWTFDQLHKYHVINMYSHDELQAWANDISIGDTIKFSNDIETHKGEIGEIVYMSDDVNWFQVKFSSGSESYNKYQLFARIMPRKYLDGISLCVYAAIFLAVVTFGLYLIGWYIPMFAVTVLVGFDMASIVSYYIDLTNDNPQRNGKYEWDIDYGHRMD